MKVGSAETIPAAIRSRSDHNWLLTQLKPNLKLYLLVVVLVTLVSLLSLVDPLIVKWLVDYVLPARRGDLLVWAMLSILAVHIVRLTLHTFVGAATNYASQTLAYRVRVKLLRRTLGLSAAFLGQTNVGDLMQRVDKDVEQVCEVGGGVASALLRMTISLVTVIGTMLYLNWRLTCVLLPCLPAFLVLRQFCRTRLQRASVNFREYVSVQSGVLHEIMTGIIQLQLLCGQRSVVRRYGQASHDCMRADIHRQKHELVFALTSAFIIAVGIAVLFGFGGWQVFKGTLSIGGLIAFYTYFTRLFDPLANAVESTTKLQRIGAHIRQVREIEGAEHQTSRISSPFPVSFNGFPILGRELCFNNVSFTYGPGVPVLKHIDLTFRAREMVAIVGPNGSGKSTLFKLITRMYEPESGLLKLDGHEIRNISVRRLRSMMSVVLQQPILFSLSLRDNILLGNPSATPAQIHRAMELACLDSVVSRLPAGLDEKIGAGGARLSGGECQRVAIARALVADKPILLLDEASSALDLESERHLISAIKTELNDHLIIAITHRPEAARVADRVVMLSEGKILDMGSHDALCDRNPNYLGLWQEPDKSGPFAQRYVVTAAHNGSA